MQVTLTYSRDSITKELNQGATLASIATPGNLAYLGAPSENVRYTSGGIELISDSSLFEGQEIFIEAKSHSKATPQDGYYRIHKFQVKFGRESVMVSYDENISEYIGCTTYGHIALSKRQLDFLGVPEVATVRFYESIVYLNGIDKIPSEAPEREVYLSGNIPSIPFRGDYDQDNDDGDYDEFGSCEVMRVIDIRRVAHAKA